MKRLLALLALLVVLLPGWQAITSADALDQAATAPAITSFTSSATSVDRKALDNSTARVAVSWASVNRPNTANLVFEQLLPDGRVTNIELPRQNPWVNSTGDGVVAPFSPGADVKEIRIRLTLLDVVNPKNYDQKELVIPIVDAQAPVIRTFATAAINVNRSELTAKTARIPVTWAVDNRPDNSNLVFEQVLADNTTPNVELPRQNPFVTSSGVGVVAPVAPGGDNPANITLRLRLVNLGTGATIVQKDITVAISDVNPSQPSVSIFSTSATTVARAALTDKSARIPVSWQVVNRPPNSNLVFEQVLDNGSVVNVELPRNNPFVASEGNGVAAPVLPGGTATSIKLQLRLIDLGNQAELAKKDFTVTINDASTKPVITTFKTTAASVNSAALNSKSERVPVTWQVDNRPANSNLVFEQVLPDNSIVNVELPRNNPFVSSSGAGVAAPVLPAANATSITLQLRLIDLSTQATLAQQSFTLPITQAAPMAIKSFTTSTTSVNRDTLTAKTARIPVAWQVDNRPPNSNLVFEQVLDNNQVINVELPRDFPFVSSSGNGVVAPVAPVNPSTTTILLRLRVIDLGNNQATLGQQTLLVQIGTGGTPTANIRTFTSPTAGIDLSTLVNRSARALVSWAVDNRPSNSNLVFEQVFPDGSSLNVELPRQNPLVASEGNGVTAPVAPGGITSQTTITLRLRLVNLLNNSTITQKDITIPVNGASDPFTQVVAVAQCFSSPFLPSNGLAVNGRGRVLNVNGGDLALTSSPTNGQVTTTLAPGETFTVLEGPYCYRYLYTSNWTQLDFRLWKVKSESRDASGWALEYKEQSPANGTIPYIESQPGTAPSTGNTDTSNNNPGGSPGEVEVQPISVMAFDVTPNPVDRGGTLSITWVTSGPIEKVTIYRIDEITGQPVALSDNQPANGTISVALDGQYTYQAGLSISAFAADGRETTSGATISVNCPFATMLTTNCPLSQDMVNAAYQSFEHGSMIWNGNTREIYVLFEDGSWQAYPDTWAEGDPEPNPGQPVPDGMLLPVRGFGKVWDEIGGLDLLGWANGQESSYTAQWEVHHLSLDPDENGMMTYIKLPDNRTAVLGGKWTIG